MLEVKVSGMSCQGCVRSVTNALKELDAQANVQVDLGNQIITIQTDKEASAVTETIEDAGYNVKAVKKV